MIDTGTTYRALLRVYDAAGVLADPSLCHQRTWGRSYWRWLEEAADPEEFAPLACCPAARAGYQLFRQQALAEALARQGRRRFVVSAVALDERNDRLAGSLRSTGLADVRDWGRLFRGAASFAVFTHQDWVAWLRANDSQGVWTGWSDWVARRYGL